MAARGRPKTIHEDRATYPLRLPQALHRELRHYAVDLGRPVSEIVVQWIRAALAQGRGVRGRTERWTSCSYAASLWEGSSHPRFPVSLQAVFFALLSIGSFIRLL
jgi:hypothetical protein